MDITRLIRQSMKRMCQSTILFFQSRFYFYLGEDLTEPDGVDGFLQKVNRQKTNVDRVNLIYEKLDKYGLLSDKYKEDKKSDDKGTRCKEKGNRFFSTGRYNKALRMYTKALLKAESKELSAVAYANRSAALFKLRLFKECLQDIDRALENNYPENLKLKLIDRKVKATELLRKSHAFAKPYEEPSKVPSNQRNPVIEYANNCVEIKNGPSRRCVVATRDIQIGDVIAIETAFAATVEEAYLYHCHDCFSLVYNPIPCDNCTQALYCSEACKENALTKYHKNECPILLSLRKLVGKNKNFLLAIKMTFYSQDERFGKVLKLTETLVDDKTFPDELFKLSMTAGFIYDLVKKHSKRFEGASEGAEASFKELVVTFMRLCIGQATGIDELCPSECDDVFSQDTIACAIFPFYSLFRHSCCPNVFGHHHGIKRVLRAIRTIKKGEECFVSYGVYYVQDSKEDRQHRLQTHYSFKCACRACKENWPQFDSQPYPIPLDEDVRFMFEIKNGNVDVAKQMISRKIYTMKQMERFEPRADFIFQQKILLHCYDVLGNKRLRQ